MASTKKIPNGKLASKLVRKGLPNLGEALVFIGKPFYFILSYLFIGLIFTTYFIGNKTHTLIKAFLNIPSFTKRVIKILTSVKLKIPKPRIKKPKPIFPKIKPIKISLPSISFPRIKIKKRPFISILLIFSAIFSFWYLILKDLPSPKQLTTRKVEVSTKIYDRNGVLLYKIYKDKNRTIVPLEKIPIHTRLATLAAEDAEFYTHPGFSIRGIVRAIIKNATKKELAGGSTITQQLVKNALLSSEKTVIRKLKEIVLAIEVELVYSKDEILEMYLNEVPYGGTAYGIQEAARIYFDKDVQNLTLAEATLLAGLPKSPTKYSPFGPTPKLGLARQKDIINLMFVNKFITKEQEDKALGEKLVFAQNKIDIKAPHFVMYTKQRLAEKYGENIVETGGLEVVTTLDYSIQKMASAVVKKEIERLKNLNVTNGAALVINPKTGEVLAMVGSKDYFNTEADGNVNVATRPRQPGSSIKIVNYAYALSNGYTPATIIDDSPVSFSVPGQPPYSPTNYDGAYRGKIPLRNALAESRNIPAVKVLASYGVDKMIQMGKKMGITTWEDKDRFGLSLTLGGGEVTLLDLAKTYSTVANYGERPKISSIVKVKDYKGKILEENNCIKNAEEKKKKENKIKLANPVDEIKAAETTTDCQNQKVLDPRVSFLLVDILKDNRARAGAFGMYSQLVIPQHPEIAVKTGTSNNLRDNLAVGFNQDYLVAVWVGNNDNSPMSRIASGITGATPIFNKIMTNLISQSQSKSWSVPERLVKVAICPLTGTLPCEGCPTRKEWFLKENTPKHACQKVQPIADVKEKGEDDSQEKEGQILPESAQIKDRRRFFLRP